MAEFAFDLTWVGIITVLGIISLVITKMLRNPNDIARENYKKMQKLDKEYIKRLEDENEQLDKDCQSLQNSLNRRERGPKVEGEPSELSEIMPDLVKEFAPHLPKWIQPLVNDPEAQKWIIEYVSKNPDKAKEWFGKMVGKKSNGNNQVQSSDMLSV